jgi:steroid 5-alpha reductase family enzyme
VEFVTAFGIGGLIILGLIIILWIISLVLKDSSIVDIFWGTGFAITGWVYFSLSPDGFIARKSMIVLLTTSVHILWFPLKNPSATH